MSLPLILTSGVLFLAIIYVITCTIFAQLILNPKRQPIVTTPAEYGLDYEDVEFQSSDGLILKGWFIPGNTRKLLLVTHPMYCNRHGFLVRNKSIFMATKTDIDLLLSIKALNEAGYSILTFDFRNHGESEGGVTGLGLNEYQDVFGAIEYLKKSKNLDDADLGLVGFCMGANSIIVALSNDPNRFSMARCFIAIQPISMSVFVRSYIKNTYTHLGLIIMPLTMLIQRLFGGHPLGEMSPLKYVKDISLPTLYIQGRNDPWTDLSDIQGFYENTVAAKEFHWLETTQCRPEAYQYIGENPLPLIDFINANMQD